MQKRILSVHDISCFGKSSNTVALPILSACGHECVVLPTALLSTHTGGFTGYTFLDLSEEMQKILRHWQQLALHFDALYTGYFANAAQMQIVDAFARPRRLLRLLDPVMGDCGKLYPAYDADFAAQMREFCKGADLITPNMTEAALLTGSKFEGDKYRPSALQRQLDALYDLQIERVVLTGVRFPGQEIGIVAAQRGIPGWTCFRTPYADTYFHGGGDTFASALCGKLLQGVPFYEAAKQALEFTYRAILRTVPTEQRYGLCFEPELFTLNNPGSV